MCVGRLATCDELESASSSFFGLSLLDVFDVNRTWPGLLLRFPGSGVQMRSVESKDSLSPSATHNTKSNVRKLPVQKGLLLKGKLTDTATGIAVDENQLITSTVKNSFASLDFLVEVPYCYYYLRVQ